MKLKPRQRASVSVWQLEGRHQGVRVRVSLDTRDAAQADRLAKKVNLAFEDGPDSHLWPELKRLLPSTTFLKLAAIGGFIEKPAPPPPPTFADLIKSFFTQMQHRIAIDKFRHSTLTRYQQTIAEFEAFLLEHKVSALPDINRAVVEQFKAWRMERIRAKKQARGGKSLSLDAAILHRVFAHAIECEMIERNPVKLEGRPGDDPESGAQPFNAEQLGKLRQAAEPDTLAFLLLRWTGFRGSDAVGLRWEEIDWSSKEFSRLTQKRRKRVVMPIHQELLFALETEMQKRQPEPSSRVLLNPATGKPLTRPRLYERMLAVGRRAGISDANPHRYRDTFAVDMLLRGASPYDVAKLLGDEVATVEKHYSPFVRELRERARRLMENSEGLESVGTVRAQPTAKPERVQ